MLGKTNCVYVLTLTSPTTIPEEKRILTLRCHLDMLTVYEGTKLDGAASSDR